MDKFCKHNINFLINLIFNLSYPSISETSGAEVGTNLKTSDFDFEYLNETSLECKETIQIDHTESSEQQLSHVKDTGKLFLCFYLSFPHGHSIFIVHYYYYYYFWRGWGATNCR